MTTDWDPVITTMEPTKSIELNKEVQKVQNLDALNLEVPSFFEPEQIEEWTLNAVKKSIWQPHG